MSDSEIPEEDVDPNISRRKRRKVTPSLPEDIAPAAEPDDSQQWLRQPEAAASEETGEFTDAPMDPPLEDEAEFNHTSITAIAGEPTDSHAATPASPTSLDGSLDAHHADVQKSNMLKLTGGKLAKSQRGPKKETPPKPSPKKSTRQTRNLAMKHGRIVRSLQLNIPYRDLTDDPASLAAKIDTILRQPPQPAEAPPPLLSTIQHVQQAAPPAQSQKALHPFFMGKVSKQHATSDTASDSGKASLDSTEPAKVLKPATAWNDLIFASSKSARPKDPGSLPAPWPPLDSQRVPPLEPIDATSVELNLLNGAAKQKQDATRISQDESILNALAIDLRTRAAAGPEIRVPQQLHMSGDKLLKELDSGLAVPSHGPKLETVRKQICQGYSAFDRGTTAGPLDWTHEYAPKRAEDVLQYDSVVLKEWLQKLKVHNVQSKAAQRQQKKRPARKKRPKKRGDDLDDFLILSDEEVDEGVAPVKNAILICGPPGRGKTASVFAAAHQLDFEVFEIHPGMRRTAKDIFDKVGDMTHNHLVQAAVSAPLSRASSVPSEIGEQSDDGGEMDTTQKSLAGFLAGKSSKVPRPAESKPTLEKELLQKQSLILFEEVDVLFEEDKTFWSGVQSLIATSKRPIILTCNNLDSVNLEELNLHATLHYTRPRVDEAVEHLAHVAAAEGHLIARHALDVLYRSRGEDLRAALMELNFWCQMTVGSARGGLDWIYHGSHRIVSKDTFYEGLHLVPEQQLDSEDLLAFAQASLDLPILDWELARPSITGAIEASPQERLRELQQADIAADFRSFMDIADEDLHPSLSCALSEALPDQRIEVTRKSLTQYQLMRPQHPSISHNELVRAFDPITDDNRTFPPPTGRTAPSLDGSALTVATDVAPYIRHIVWLDRQMEKVRGEIDVSSQGTGRQRRTRAARAAVEGGNVAHTRVERWFPKDLDFDAVLATGGGWTGLRDQWLASTETPSLSRDSTGMTDATTVMDVD